MFEVSAINLSSRWDEDMGKYLKSTLKTSVALAVNATQPESVLFHQMLYIQKWGYIFLSALSLYFCHRIATHSLMHFNFRIILVCFFGYIL
jgi:hypothetical protein